MSKEKLEVVRYFLQEFAINYNTQANIQSSSPRYKQVAKQIEEVRDACDQLRRALSGAGEAAGDFLLARPFAPFELSYRPMQIAPDERHIEEVNKMLRWSDARRAAQAGVPSLSRYLPQADSRIAEAALRWIEEVNDSLLAAAEFALKDLAQLPDRGGATNAMKPIFGSPKTALVANCLDLYEAIIKDPKPTLTWNSQPAVELIRCVYEYATGLGVDEKGNDLRAAYREVFSSIERTDDSLRRTIEETLARYKASSSSA